MSRAMMLFQSIVVWATVVIKDKKDKLFTFYITWAYNIFSSLIQLLCVLGMAVFIKGIDIYQIYFEKGKYKSGALLIATVLLLIVYFGVYKFRKENNVDLEPFKWGFLLYIVSGIFALIVLQREIIIYKELHSKKITIFLCLGILATLFLLAGTSKIVSIKMKLKLLEYQNTLLENNYQEIKSMYQDYMFTYHDMKNHMIVLQNYCITGETEKALNYIQNIQKSIEQVKQYIVSGNAIMDIILNYKISEAEKTDICIETEVDKLEEIAVEEYDMCAILANLLDNAIEGCRTAEDKEKKIRILIKRLGDAIFINVMNTCYCEDRVSLKKLKSRKGKGHGYGLQSVKNRVMKYGGDIQCEKKENNFIVTIIFMDLRKKIK